ISAHSNTDLMRLSLPSSTSCSLRQRAPSRWTCSRLEYFFVVTVGLVAGTLSGIVGFGSSIMLMPVLVIAFGPLQAVPIMAIAAIMAKLSRDIGWGGPGTRAR